MSQDKAHPTPSDYCRMDDGRCGICGGDWSVCGCQGMLDRRSLAAPVASNTTAEPAPIQPAGVEVESLPELPAPQYWWEPTPESGLLKSNAGWSTNTGPAPSWLVTHYFTAEQMRDYALQARAAASQGDRGKT